MGDRFFLRNATIKQRGDRDYIINFIRNINYPIDISHASDVIKKDKEVMAIATLNNEQNKWYDYNTVFPDTIEEESIVYRHDDMTVDRFSYEDVNSGQNFMFLAMNGINPITKINDKNRNDDSIIFVLYDLMKDKDILSYERSDIREYYQMMTSFIEETVGHINKCCRTREERIVTYLKNKIDSNIGIVKFRTNNYIQLSSDLERNDVNFARKQIADYGYSDTLPYFSYRIKGNISFMMKLLKVDDGGFVYLADELKANAFFLKKIGIEMCLFKDIYDKGDVRRSINHNCWIAYQFIEDNIDSILKDTLKAKHLLFDHLRKDKKLIMSLMSYDIESYTYGSDMVRSDYEVIQLLLSRNKENIKYLPENMYCQLIDRHDPVKHFHIMHKYHINFMTRLAKYQGNVLFAYK